MSNRAVTIVDYGMGNLYSVSRAIESLGFEPILTSEKKAIISAEKLILPGVGAFAQGMAELRRLELIDTIREYYASGKPFFGICLGMQMMLDIGEEFGIHSGLGLIPGKVVKIPSATKSGEKLKVPHIGWNSLREVSGGASWKTGPFHSLTTDASVYFVHSYVAEPESRSHVLATVEYGGHDLVAAVTKDRAIGCQFHPERSGKVGLQILSNFLNS